MKFLVTGFEPFGGEAVNPSWEAVKGLPEEIGQLEIVKQCLPTCFGKAAELLLETVKREKPRAVLSVGLAGGRKGISLERVALNLRDARIPDNAGSQPVDEPVAEEGPAAIFTTLPIKAMLRALEEAGIPGRISNSAGTFVCNEVMYMALYQAGVSMAGFVHVPYLPEQAEAKTPPAPGMALEDMIRGLEILVKTAAGQLA